MRDDDGNPCETEGASCRLRFGDTDEACTDKRPFEFSHVYSCEGPGNCVFTPKVQVLDNWGWCNGTCQGTEGCYEGEPPGGLKQCVDPPTGFDSYESFSGEIILTP